MKLPELIQAARAALDPKNVDVVIYHHPCNDGAAGALAGWMACGARTQFIPQTNNKPIADSTLEAIKDKNVAMIDVTYSKEQTRELRKITKKLIVLDHHEGALKELAAEPDCFIIESNANSGAVLGWHYFHGIDTPAPRFFQLIEDRDLWRWSERELSEPLNYALVAKHQTLDHKSFVEYIDLVALDAAIQFGKTLMAENLRWCETKAAVAEKRVLTVPGDTNTASKDYLVMAVQLEDHKLISELGELLYTKNPEVDLVILFYPQEDGSFKLSLRSPKTGANVSEIAKKMFSGAGHAHAAGGISKDSPWGVLSELGKHNKRLELGI